MIYIPRTPAPLDLTPDVQVKLTQEFIATSSDVWNKSYIRSSLMAMSHKKCCYCEAYIDEESKYMEVDHYHHKNLYKHEVVEWNNLLPSCKRCNTSKGTHDTNVEAIVNPTSQVPSNHLKLQNYRIKGKDRIGDLTEKVIDLNDTDRLTYKRFQIGESIQNALIELDDAVDNFANGTKASSIMKTKIIKKMRCLQIECQPASEYSATCATIVIQSDEYLRSKLYFKQADWWTNEMECFHKFIAANSLA